ncbi:MAG: hypothetical protein AVDCRST_MAG57-3367, partial [uncultured Blastococcus sp.]
ARRGWRRSIRSSSASSIRTSSYRSRPRTRSRPGANSKRFSR